MNDPSQKPPYTLRRMGGEVDSDRLLNVPGIVLFVAVLTVLCYVVMALSPVRAARIIEATAAVSPARFSEGLERHEGWLPLLSPFATHMFIHASIAHVSMNMLFFLAMGSPVARRMNAEGALQSVSSMMAAVIFVIFYVLSGAAGAAAYIAAHANEPTLLIGASGGVSGLLGGLVRFAFNRSTIFGPEYATMSPLNSPGVISWSIVIIALNIMAGLFGGVITGGVNIAWEAHIGGYLFGLLTYPFFERVALMLE